MLGLPKSTELSKQLPKKAIYAKFQMNASEKEKIDTDISRITIVNEVSPERINIAAGDTVKQFYVLNVQLKRKNFNEKSIVMVSKLIPQNILFVLEYENQFKLAVYHSKLIATEWMDREEASISLKGLNFDKLWENIIVQIGNIEIEDGNKLNEQIAIDETRQKIKKEIEKLERQARNEKQPKKKFEIVKKISSLKSELK